MIEYDTLQRFLFTEAPVRGEIIRMRSSYQAILARHPYPLPVCKLLGQALAASALLSATIKLDGSLILQIESNGPIKTLVAQCNHHFHLRGLALWQENIDTDTLEQAPFSKGRLALTITSKQGERYQGLVELDSNDLASAIEKYFRDSEQLSTLLFLFANEKTVAGMLLQTLPHDIGALETEDFWEHILHLAKTLTAQEFLSLDNQTILHRLFHEENMQLFDPEPVSFRCNCSKNRMEQALLSMRHEELQELLQAYKKIDVTCEFCNYQYTFDAVDIAKIFADDKNMGSDSTIQH